MQKFCRTETGLRIWIFVKTAAGSLTMRILVFVLALFVAIAGNGTRAEAQNYPWCAVLNMGDAAYNCGFVSREQCMATVSGIGGSCEPNTQYHAPSTAVHPVPRSSGH
jgi:hypothetical protein